MRENFPLKEHYVNLFVISEYLEALMHFLVSFSVNESLVQINQKCCPLQIGKGG